MPRSPDRSPPPAVTVSGGPATPAPSPPPDTGGGSRRPAVVLVVGVAVLLAALAVRDARRTDRLAEARAAAGLRLDVVAARAVERRGVPAQSTQTGLVDVVLRNQAARPVRLAAVSVDGSADVTTGSGSVVRPGRSTTVRVGWRVECAEIGNVPGPRLLDLRVRLSSSAVYDVVVPLPGPVTDRAFHGAASTACDVLVAG